MVSGNGITKYGLFSFERTGYGIVHFYGRKKIGTGNGAGKIESLHISCYNANILQILEILLLWAWHGKCPEDTSDIVRPAVCHGRSAGHYRLYFQWNE